MLSKEQERIKTWVIVFTIFILFLFLFIVFQDKLIDSTIIAIIKNPSNKSAFMLKRAIKRNVNNNIILDSLFRLCSHSDKEIRDECQELISEGQGEEFVDKLIYQLNNGDIHSAKLSAYILANRRVKRAVPSLIRRLQSSNPHFRISIVAGLVSFQDKRATMLLIDLLKRDSINRFEIINSIGIQGDKKAAPFLIPYLSNDNPDIRRISINALGHLKATEYKQQIIDLTDDKNALVRMYACDFLAELGDKSDIDILNMKTQDSSAHVRKSARNAIESIELRESGKQKIKPDNNEKN